MKFQTMTPQWLIAKREEIDRRLDRPGIPLEMLKALVDAGAKVDAEMDRRAIDPYDGPHDADTGVPITIDDLKVKWAIDAASRR